MQDDVCHIDRNVMTTLSMYVRNFKLTDLWSLESLGISNPTLEESKQNSYEDALNDFQQKLTILHNGRYELQLPWKHDPVNLPDNKGLTWARHAKVIKRAESNGFLREYQKVFEDWENLGIIETVPEEGRFMLRKELSELSSDDIENAERVLIRLVQDKMFPNLKSIPIVNVFKDNEGIIRVKTKITERKDDPNFIAPILMPSKCLLTTRLIEYYHLKHCHAGVQILMSILRETFWIMKTLKTVREVVMKCVPCRRYSSNSPMSEPVSLPADRVKDANAFDITGIDLAGPLFTRDGGKVWIVLYTCAIYRVIHLELVSSLSTECFMLSLRRFIARRTRPESIYTDNGTNFVGTNRN
ncbi:integrase catalytic domain-containing protein [Trichonephila clavipes]|nr:integrase catalytic domain-containing protein [Trichonephila clavipes]